MAKRLFTSESVTEGHPDKICDQISDAILDAIMEKDPNGRVACETCVSTGLIHIMGEITTSCYVDIPKIAREVIRDIGYDRAKYGEDGELAASGTVSAVGGAIQPGSVGCQIGKEISFITFHRVACTLRLPERSCHFFVMGQSHFPALFQA